VVVLPTLRPEDLVELRALTLQDVAQALSPQRVNHKVMGFFNGHATLHVRELPPDVLADLHWLTTIVAYAHHPEVAYGLEVTGGDPLWIGHFRVAPFELIKSTPT
jgi:hypothetical protein